MAKHASISPRAFIPMQGRWQFSGSVAKYLGTNDEAPSPVGVCLSPIPFRSGTASVRAKFVGQATAARIIIGYNATTGGYYSIGLGGYGSAYLVDAFIPG